MSENSNLINTNTDMSSEAETTKPVVSNDMVVEKEEDQVDHSEEEEEEESSEEEEGESSEEESGSEYDSDEEYDDEEYSDEDGLTAEDAQADLAGLIGDIMNKEGPFVKCIILKANGSTEEQVLDMTPKKSILHKIFGGAPTFLGQWDENQVIIAHAKDPSTAMMRNKHTLPPPYNVDVVYGDIVLVRMDDDAEPQDFPIEEWKDFLAKGLAEIEEEEKAHAPFVLCGHCVNYNVNSGRGTVLVKGDDVEETKMSVSQNHIYAAGFKSLRDGEAVEVKVQRNESGELVVLTVTGPSGAFVKGASQVSKPVARKNKGKKGKGKGKKRK